jgi:hypothetical protein
MTAHRISETFGVRLTRKLRGKLATVIEQIEHGHHVFRVNSKNALLRQYEKFSRFLRNKLQSNNLTDFGLRKGLDHLDSVRPKVQATTDRFAGFQAQTLNVHVDFPLLQRLALPITFGTVRYPGIRIQDDRVIRLLEVLLHGGTTVGGWTAKQIHHAVLAAFQLSAKAYGLNQLRYDLRKLKGHGLLQRDGRRYAYRLTTKGVQVALLWCVLPSFILVTRASGSWGFTHSSFDPFFFRFRSTRAKSSRVGVEIPDCCASSSRPLPHKFVTPKKTTCSLFGVSLIVWRRAGPN